MDEQKSPRILSNLDGNAFGFFNETFEENGGRKPFTSYCAIVEQALVEEFEKKCNPRMTSTQLLNLHSTPETYPTSSVRYTVL